MGSHCFCSPFDGHFHFIQGSPILLVGRAGFSRATIFCNNISFVCFAFRVLEYVGWFKGRGYHIESTVSEVYLGRMGRSKIECMTCMYRLGGDILMFILGELDRRCFNNLYTSITITCATCIRSTLLLLVMVVIITRDSESNFAILR